MQNLNQDNGYSLLEVAIALLILSIGILNLAKIQAFALIRNHNAYLYSMAAEQISSLCERLQVGQIAREIPIWQHNISSLLPKGYGQYNSKTISVCWFDRFTHSTKCLKKAHNV